MRPTGPADQVRELMGAGSPSSTLERKAAKKAAKAGYAAELQAQMRLNEEAKMRDRMERRGIVRPPPLQAQPSGGFPAGGGPQSPGAFGGGGVGGFGHASPGALSVYQAAMPPGPGFPPLGSPGGGGAPPSNFNQQQQYQQQYQQQQQQQYQQQQQLAMPPPYQPGGPLGSMFNHQPANPFASSPPFYGASGFGPQPPGVNSPPPPGFGPGGSGSGYGPMVPGGGYAVSGPPPPPLLPGPAPPPGPGRDTLRRMEQQAKKDQYRLDLEAQIRDREERKVAEKVRRQEEDRRKEVEMAAAAAREGMHRGGGGAPFRDAAGNVVANLGQMQRGGMAGMGHMGPPHQGLANPGGGMGMANMMHPPPPPQLVGSPPGMGGIGGAPQLMGGQMPPQLMHGGGPPMAGSPSGMGVPPPGMMMMGLFGGGGPMDGAPPGVLPNFRFRSDNAYLTPKEVDNKQRQARELQEALEQQIQEKRRAKEMEKQREMVDMEREEVRYRGELEQQRGGGGPQDGGGGSGGARSKEDMLADALEKARQGAEELRRNKFALKRGAGGVSRGLGGAADEGLFAPRGGGRSGVVWAEGGGVMQDGVPSPPSMQPPPVLQRGGSGFGDIQWHPSPAMPLTAASQSSTHHMVVEQVRQVAAAELAAVKQELVAEAAQLREVVAAQGQQVAALKSHSERMEAEAERAREQVAVLRLGQLIPPRGAVAAAAGEGGSDFQPEYDRQLATVPPPQALADIDLDLPPTGAMLRRTAAPPPMYDMGPVIPAVSNSIFFADNAAASSIHTSNAPPLVAGGRLPSRVRLMNPLEASMAGESVFIFPNGREVARSPNVASDTRVGAVPSTSPSGPLPIQSIQMAGSGATTAPIPTVLTTQELDAGPVPLTPQGGGGLAPPVDASDGALSMTASVAASVVSPIGVGTFSVQAAQPVASVTEGRIAGAQATPLDVMMIRNKEKLEMLQGITDLTSGAASIEALDDFLTRYAAQRPGLPERTATPVLRLGTPLLDAVSSQTASPDLPLRNGSLASVSNPTSSGLQPQQSGSTAVYSSRANSMNPLPMGGGRVLAVGSVSKAASAAGNSTPGGSSLGGSSNGGGGTGAASAGAGANLLDGDSAVGSGRLMVSPLGLDCSGGASRRSSFTGECCPQEGVLSQMREPVSRPKIGPESTGPGGLRAASPMPGRPPMLPSKRFSTSGSRVGTPVTAGAMSGYLPSSRPATGAAAASPGSGGGVAAATAPPSRSASRTTSVGGAASLPPSRATRPLTRGSEDGICTAASAWPSYYPSRESSAGGMGQSPSRSLSAHNETRPGATQSAPLPNGHRSVPDAVLKGPHAVAPLPEDTLDVEMRKGLGAAAAAPSTPPSPRPYGSLPGTPSKTSSHKLRIDAGMPTFLIPRSPMLGGVRRISSASNQPGSLGD